MTKAILVNEERLEKLLKVINSCDGDCPAEIFGETPSWCNEEYCISCEEYDCIKKWLEVKELPKRKKGPSDSGQGYFELNEQQKQNYEYIIGKVDGFNECLEEMLGEEK